MVFQWLDGIWQLRSSYRGKQFEIKLIRPRTATHYFIASVKIDGELTRLSIVPDTDFNNVGKEASVAVLKYIDAAA